MKNGSLVAAEKRRLLKKVSKGFRSAFIFLFFLSGIINILALTGAFYMLQIYDRALSSGSIPTLLMISALAVGLYLSQGIFDVLRSQILVRLGAQFDRRVSPETHRVTVDMPRYGFSSSEALDRGRDVDVVRGFLGSHGPIALLDLPWTPVFLLFIYALHPLLGALTLGGAFVLTVLAATTELLTRRSNGATRQASIERDTIAESNTRNAEVIRAMGFASRAVARFRDANERHLSLQTGTNDVAGTLGSFSKVLRMILQSAVLGLGAYLTILGHLSPGAIIAASVAAARALAPIDMSIANWKNMATARAAYKRVKETVQALAGETPPMRLPAPKRSLKVENVTVASPDTGRVLMSDVSFELEAGQALGIIGPSGGGKTTLLRAIAGVWPTLRGSIRLDEAALPQFDEETIGQSVGYLPQEYALFNTTIERNITRLQANSDPKDIIGAAQAAGVHEMIVRLPDGYQTDLGPQGTSLSGGQRQRVALARALYGAPFVVLLDEPNSNLDTEGEASVSQAIRAVKERGGIVVVIAHRPSALEAVDFVAVVQNGRMTRFGTKEEILRLKKAETPAAPQPARREAPRPAAGADVPNAVAMK